MSRWLAAIRGGQQWIQCRVRLELTDPVDIIEFLIRDNVVCRHLSHLQIVRAVVGDVEEVAKHSGCAVDRTMLVGRVASMLKLSPRENRQYLKVAKQF